jgi:hypothetical protein
MINEVTNMGVLTTSFNQETIMPSNISDIDETALTLTIIPGEGSYLNDLVFTWTIINTTTSTMNI